MYPSCWLVSGYTGGPPFCPSVLQVSDAWLDRSLLYEALRRQGGEGRGEGRRGKERGKGRTEGARDNEKKERQWTTAGDKREEGGTEGGIYVSPCLITQLLPVLYVYTPRANHS